MAAIRFREMASIVYSRRGRMMEPNNGKNVFGQFDRLAVLTANMQSKKKANVVSRGTLSSPQVIVMVIRIESIRKHSFIDLTHIQH